MADQLKVCANCGEENAMEETFCTYCGQVFNTPDEEGKPEEPSASAPAEPETQSPATINSAW
jgi:hypothetical protein